MKKKQETPKQLEARMLKFQKVVQKMMKKEGIALVAYPKNPEAIEALNNLVKQGIAVDIAVSFVAEEKWDAEAEKKQQQIMDELLKEQGDPITKWTPYCHKNTQ